MRTLGFLDPSVFCATENLIPSKFNGVLAMVYMVQLAELSSTFPCERQTYDEFWWEVPGLIMEKNERQTYDEFRWEVLGLIMNSDERCQTWSWILMRGARPDHEFWWEVPGLIMDSDERCQAWSWILMRGATWSWKKWCGIWRVSSFFHIKDPLCIFRRKKVDLCIVTDTKD